MFRQINQKCENSSVNVAIVNSVLELFFASPFNIKAKVTLIKTLIKLYHNPIGTSTIRSLNIQLSSKSAARI